MAMVSNAKAYFVDHLLLSFWKCLGCPNPDMCMPGTYFTGGVDGIDCPAHCPAQCNPEWQMVCEGAFDADGKQSIRASRMSHKITIVVFEHPIT